MQKFDGLNAEWLQATYEAVRRKARQRAPYIKASADQKAQKEKDMHQTNAAILKQSGSGSGGDGKLQHEHLRQTSSSHALRHPAHRLFLLCVAC
jgi:hypothetical protein